MNHNVIGPILMNDTITIGLGTLSNPSMIGNGNFYGFLTIMKSTSTSSGYELYLTPKIILNTLPLSVNFDTSVQQAFGYTDEEFNNDVGLATQNFIINRESSDEYTFTPIGLSTTNLNGRYIVVPSTRDPTDGFVIYDNSAPLGVSKYSVTNTPIGPSTTANLLYGIDYDVRAYRGNVLGYFQIDVTELSPGVVSTWLIRTFTYSSSNPNLLVLSNETNFSKQLFDGYLSINKNLDSSGLPTKPIFTFLPERNHNLYNLNNSCSTSIQTSLGIVLDSRDIFRMSYTSPNSICSTYNLLPTDRCTITTTSDLCRVSGVTTVGPECRSLRYSACPIIDEQCTWNNDDNEFECTTDNVLYFDTFLPLFIIITILLVTILGSSFIIFYIFSSK